MFVPQKRTLPAVQFLQVELGVFGAVVARQLQRHARVAQVDRRRADVGTARDFNPVAAAVLVGLAEVRRARRVAADAQTEEAARAERRGREVRDRRTAGPQVRRDELERRRRPSRRHPDAIRRSC